MIMHFDVGVDDDVILILRAVNNFASSVSNDLFF